jgi:hypothetical protein
MCSHLRSFCIWLPILLLLPVLSGCSGDPVKYAEEKKEVVNTADAVGAVIDVICPVCSSALGRD